MNTFASPLKSPTYMPPIRSSEKQLKPYYSPSGPNLSRKASNLFMEQPSPRKESIPNTLKPVPPKQPSLSEREVELKSRGNHEKTKSLTVNTTSATGLKTLTSYTPREQMIDAPENTPNNQNDPDDDETKIDPQNTFDLFMNRFSKVQNKNIIPNYEPSRHSDKSHGIVKAFAVCTNQGLVRNYNEDRVAIVLNILRPPNRDPSDYWPNCSIFGIFDGHGGAKCAEYLRNNLHHFIIKSKNFPWNPQEALKDAFEEADTAFLKIADTEEGEGKHDRSGSCALVMMIVDDNCYICNLGDSRAILSQGSGQTRIALTRDHKPSEKLEQKRIQEAGGKVYQNFPLGPNGKRLDLDPKTNPFKVTIPFRVFPGRLSVSRAFGDIEAKSLKYGGNPNVLISKPEITSLKIAKDHDFILLGCDGIYDKSTNEELIGIVWDTLKKKESKNIHELLKHSIENVIKDSMLKKSLDNVTAIILAFSNLETKFSGFESQEARPYSKAETHRYSIPRPEMRKSEDYSNLYPLKTLSSSTTPTHYQTPSVGSNPLNSATPLNGSSYNELRIRTPVKTNNSSLKDMTNKIEPATKTEQPHTRKVSASNLPKLMSKTPRVETYK